jgi:hypothetical protein
LGKTKNIKISNKDDIMPAKYSHAFVKKELKDRNFLLLEEYSGMRIPVKLKCIKHNYTWNACPGSIMNGQGCKKCGEEKKRMATAYEYKDVKLEIEKRNGKLLSLEYINNKKKLLIECEYGHKWEVCFASIIYLKTWCPYCGGQAKHTLEDCIISAKNRGGQCLSNKYKNSSTKMIWQCKEKHIWKTTYNSILCGKWCACCYGNTRKTIDDCHKLAKINNGCCLSNECLNSRSIIKWKCDNKHVWKTAYNNIASGKWCPECSYSKTQKYITSIIKELFIGKHIMSNFKKFKWLKTKRKGKLELDIYIPDIKLAIEYDGRQHFMPVNFGGISDEEAANNYRAIKNRDKLKNKKIKEHPEDVKYFIRFNYKEKITKEYVVKKLKANGILI